MLRKGAVIYQGQVTLRVMWEGYAVEKMFHTFKARKCSVE